jgi:hypothetical protein
MTDVQKIYPNGRVTLREVGLRDGLQLVKTVPSTQAKQRWVRDEYAAGVRCFEVGSFLPAKTFPQFVDVREVVATVASLPGAHGVALALNERGVNEALASGVAEIASVVSATEEHSQANANRSRESAIANVKRMCDLRDASAHKPIVHAAISMALGCSIAGAVDPNEVVRLVEKCFEAGVDAVGIADTVGYAGPRHGYRKRRRGARRGRAHPRRLARRPRRLSVRAGRDRQCRVRGSGVPLREQGFCHRHRYRQADRGARHSPRGDAERDALWRARPRRPALRHCRQSRLELGCPQPQCVADHTDRRQCHRRRCDDR